MAGLLTGNGEPPLTSGWILRELVVVSMLRPRPPRHGHESAEQGDGGLDHRLGSGIAHHLFGIGLRCLLIGNLFLVLFHRDDGGCDDANQSETSSQQPLGHDVAEAFDQHHGDGGKCEAGRDDE